MVFSPEVVKKHKQKKAVEQILKIRAERKEKWEREKREKLIHYRVLRVIQEHIQEHIKNIEMTLLDPYFKAMCELICIVVFFISCLIFFFIKI